MVKIELPQVTLITYTDQDIKGHHKALLKSMEGINFGKVILCSPQNDSVSWNQGGKDFVFHKQIEPIGSIDEWNRRIIFDLPRFIETSHALLIHQDGYVINPTLWNPEWLELDYIGAPWPLPQDDYSYRSESGKIQRVGNSVSLRSKKLMDLVATRPMEYHFGNNNEDGQICCWNREWLESQGCKFATFEQALHFGKEHTLPENENLETFLFHQV
jgi:hypothetical protein